MHLGNATSNTNVYMHMYYAYCICKKKKLFKTVYLISEWKKLRET